MEHLLHSEFAETYSIKDFAYASADFGSGGGESKFIVKYDASLNRQDIYEWIDDDCYRYCTLGEDCYHAKCIKSAYASISDDVRFTDWHESLGSDEE